MTGNHKLHGTARQGLAGVDFDAVVDRRGSSATKWRRYEDTGILPFWVADMDFPTPPLIFAALQERLQHQVLGYTDEPASMAEAACNWLQRNYQWTIQPDWLVWLPGVVPGMNQACRAVGGPGDSVMVPTPVYYPFLRMPANAERRKIVVPLVLEQRLEQGADNRRWVMDFAAMAAAVTADTRLLLLANPQNPTGRVYDQGELSALAQFAERHNLVVASDEIHCPLVLPAAPGSNQNTPQHRPMASLDPAVAARSISLFSPTKAYNTPSLGCAFAVIPDQQLRARFKHSHHGLVPSIGALAWAAAEAALNDQGPWLGELNHYLAGNRDLLHEVVAQLSGVQTTPVEATYLAWLDVRELGLADPAGHCRNHGLALNDGAPFGSPGFLRFNFGCARSLLQDGLDRLAAAVHAA